MASHRLRRAALAAAVIIFAWDTPASAQLASADLERLEPFAAAWESADQPLGMLSLERQREIADATARARDAFAGRGPDLARHFLTHTDHEVRSEAYWFVLGALADPDAAVALIRALPDPPQPASGVLPRDQGGIGIALETMMAAPAIADNAVVAEALIAVIDAHAPNAGPPDVAVGLLGRSRTAASRAALGRLLTHRSPQVRGMAARVLGREPAAPGEPSGVPLGPLVHVLEPGNPTPPASASSGGAPSPTRPP